MPRMPAITLIATPGRRSRMIELAQEAERRDFTGVYVPSLSATLPYCQSILEATNTIEVASSIQPIYYYNPREMAVTAAYMHEVGGGRFRLGLGVSHEIMRTQFGVTGRSDKPVSDVRDYLTGMREAEPAAGPLPPIILATLRSRMLALAAENAQGAVWANASRRYMASQLAEIADSRKAGFTTAAMIPTTIDDNESAAAAVNRGTLEMYLNLPNYRNYWRAAGYEEEMAAVEQALEAGNGTELAAKAGDEWLNDVTLYGSASKVREGLEAWFDTGIDTPVLVPSSTRGGMGKAAGELFAALDN